MAITIKYENSKDNKAPIERIYNIPNGAWLNVIETDYQERLNTADDGEEVSRRSAQEIMDEEINKPTYNLWHREYRHRGEISKPFRKDDEDADDTDGIDTVADYSQEVNRTENEEYEEIFQWIRAVLPKKPKWAEAFIAIEMKGARVNDYAAYIGVKDASVVSHWLERARKKLAEHYPNRQI